MLAFRSGRAIMRLGDVRMTSDHDWRQFSYAVLTVLATLSFIGWAAFEGYFQLADAGMGRPFTIGFAVLLVWGMGQGLKHSYQLSFGINAIKHCKSPSELESLFGFSPDTRISPQFLEKVVHDRLNQKVEEVTYPRNLAATLGFFGTVLGMVLAIDELQTVQSPADVFKTIPEMGDGLSLTFYTTLVSTVVTTAIYAMMRRVRNCAIELKTGMFRVLQRGDTAT